MIENVLPNYSKYTSLSTSKYKVIMTQFISKDRHIKACDASQFTYSENLLLCRPLEMTFTKCNLSCKIDSRPSSWKPKNQLFLTHSNNSSSSVFLLLCPLNNFHRQFPDGKRQRNNHVQRQFEIFQNSQTHVHI